MKYIKILFLCFLGMVALSGCGNTKEIDQRTIVLGMGIDKEKEEYIVTMQIAILMPGGQQQSSNGQSNEFETITGRGKFVWDAIAEIETKTPTVLYFGHLKTIAIGENLAREGLNQVTDLLDRRAPLANEVYLLVVRSKNSVKEFLDNESPLVSLPALYIDRYFTADQKISRTVDAKLFEYRRDTNMIAAAAMVPLAYAENEIEIEDMAVMKDQKLVGELNGHEAGMAILLKDTTLENVNYSLDVNQDGKTMQTTIRNNLEMDWNFNKTIPVEIILTVKGLGELVYLLPAKQGATNEIIQGITEATEKEIEKEIKQTISKMQELNVDPFLLGHRIWAKDYEFFNKLNWEESGWKDAIVNVDVKIELEQTGQRGLFEKKKIGR